MWGLTWGFFPPLYLMLKSSQTSFSVIFLCQGQVFPPSSSFFFFFSTKGVTVSHLLLGSLHWICPRLCRLSLKEKLKFSSCFHDFSPHVILAFEDLFYLLISSVVHLVSLCRCTIVECTDWWVEHRLDSHPSLSFPLGIFL